MNTQAKILCAHCKTPFLRETRRVKENKKLNQNSFCSRRCLSQYRIKRIFFSCANERCLKTFSRLLSAISPANYCSQTCAARVNNIKFPKRIALVKICANHTCGKQFKNNDRYCSFRCRVAGEQKYSKSDLIGKIQSFAKNAGRVPAKRELNSVAEACVNAFGSWNNAIIAAHLTPHRSHDNRMYKRVMTKALDGHRCDSISEAIIHNWLAKHGVLHKRDAAYTDTNYKADWEVKKGETFVEYFGLAKDSPRYDRSIEVKKELCREHRIRLIEIYPQDLYPKIRLTEKLGVLLKVK